MSGAGRTAEARVAACYRSWAAGYHQEWYGPEAPYPPVHLALIRRLLVEHAPATLLDAGCGPASMLRELVDLKIDLCGFDLTPTMVDEARRTLGALGQDGERVWQGSVRDASAFRAPEGRNRFDAVLCIGVLPHVEAAHEATVLDNLFAALNPGGLAIIEARNALFGLFTLNRRTRDLLARELIGASAVPGHADLVRRALDDLEGRLRMDLPPVRCQADGGPGFEEVARSHNPLLLPCVMEAAGFTHLEVLFYHYHALPPAYQSLDPATFREVSLEREDPHDWRGHFMASAFLVKGIRP